MYSNQSTSNEHKTISKAIVIKECREAIAALKSDKTAFSPDALSEKAVANWIKLGEALTFCRDRRVLRWTGIVDQAIDCAKVRNNLVHHHMYDDGVKKRELSQDIQKINLDNLEKALKQIELMATETLSKPVGKPDIGADFWTKESDF